MAHLSQNPRSPIPLQGDLMGDYNKTSATPSITKLFVSVGRIPKSELKDFFVGPTQNAQAFASADSSGPTLKL